MSPMRHCQHSLNGPLLLPTFLVTYFALSFDNEECLAYIVVSAAIYLTSKIVQKELEATVIWSVCVLLVFEVRNGGIEACLVAAALIPSFVKVDALMFAVVVTKLTLNFQSLDIYISPVLNGLCIGALLRMLRADHPSTPTYHNFDAQEAPSNGALLNFERALARLREKRYDIWQQKYRYFWDPNALRPNWTQTEESDNSDSEVEVIMVRNGIEDYQGGFGGPVCGQSVGVQTDRKSGTWLQQFDSEWSYRLQFLDGPQVPERYGRVVQDMLRGNGGLQEPNSFLARIWRKGVNVTKWIKSQGWLRFAALYRRFL